MPFVNEMTDEYFQTIDRERNIILRSHFANAPDCDTPHTLEWHGQIIRFDVEEEVLKKYKTETSWKFDLHKRVCRLEIPEGFPESYRTIISFIEDALLVYGASQSTERTGYVEVEFSPSIQKRLLTS